jgi:hypothetical protein
MGSDPGSDDRPVAESNREDGDVLQSARDRGVGAASGRPAPSRTGRRLPTRAVLTALIVLVVSAASSLTWTLAQGGVRLPPRSGDPAAGGVTPTASVAAGAALPTPSAHGSSPVARESHRPQSSAPPSAGPAPGPSEGPVVARPSPTSDRYAVLVACPGIPDCYRYEVRAGDNLWSIARWFGIPLATVYELNPALRLEALRPGMEIRLPTPTR